jgi:hypothetical protein
MLKMQPIKIYFTIFTNVSIHNMKTDDLHNYIRIVELSVNLCLKQVVTDEDGVLEDESS